MWLWVCALLLAGAPDKKTCYCPETELGTPVQPEQVFTFASGRQIALCGSRNADSQPATYSEFILSVCGQKDVLGFWSALQECRLRMVKDTLLIEELKYLPTGIGFRYTKSVWTTEKISFGGEEPERQKTVNRGIRKYTTPEITEVLQQYDAAPKEVDDNTMTLINRLFVAAISGSAKAREYFKASATHFGVLDGAYAEEYNELKTMLEAWDKS